MPVYQITYDLRQQRDDSSLIEHIKSYRRWCRPLQSAWIIVTNHNAMQIRDNLKVYLGSDDELLITRLRGEAAWSGLFSDVSLWLEDHLQ